MQCISPYGYRTAKKEIDRLYKEGKMTEEEYDKNECLLSDMLGEYETINKEEDIENEQC